MRSSFMNKHSGISSIVASTRHWTNFLHQLEIRLIDYNAGVCTAHGRLDLSTTSSSHEIFKGWKQNRCYTDIYIYLQSIPTYHARQSGHVMPADLVFSGLFNNQIQNDIIGSESIKETSSDYPDGRPALSWEEIVNIISMTMQANTRSETRLKLLFSCASRIMFLLILVEHQTA